MVKKYPDLERGESSRRTKRRHILTRVFKQAVHLTKKAARIKAKLSDINPFNVGKKKEAALELLHKWFPAMEDFETEINKYKGTPYEQRSLPRRWDRKDFHEYEVLKPIQAKEGKVIPYFGEPGGGTQYKFDTAIRELLKSGYLRRIK